MGGAVLVDERIESRLKEQSEVTTLVIENLSPDLKFHIRSNTFLLLRVLFRMLLTCEPYNVSKFRFQKKAYSFLLLQLNEIIPKNVEIVTSGWISALAASDAGLLPHIHIAHNVEYIISKSFSNPALSFLRDWRKLRKLEINIYKKYNSVFTLSNTDLKILQRDNLRNLEVFNVFNESADMPKLKIELPIRIGFIGSMYWPANIHAFNSIVTNVLPLLKKKSIDYIFVIAGRGTEIISTKNSIEILGVVENVEEFYSKIDLVIIPRNPKLVTGISVKALEALEHGKFVIGDAETMTPFLNSNFARIFQSYEDIAEIVGLII